MTPCIFCGKPADSAEHVWSDGLKALMQTKFPARNGAKSYLAAQRLSPLGDIDDYTQHGGPLWTVKLKVVCSTCNNGWMSRLEKRALSIIREMMIGNKLKIMDQERRYLASWISLKTIIIEQYGQETSCITQSEIVNFYLTGNPPSRLTVRLARTTSHIWQNAMHRQPLVIANLTTGRRLISGAIMVWGLLELLVFTEVGQDTSSAIPFGTSVLLWPGKNITTWPPAFPLATEAISAIATRYFPNFQSAAEHPHTFGAPQKRNRQ